MDLDPVFDRLGLGETELIENVDELARNRGLYIQTGEPYGGTAGFWTYGPNGSPIKRNVENAWREEYVVNEGNMEIEAPTVMEEAVFEASGHIEDFDDWQVDCPSCGQSSRADHIVEDNVPGIEEAESMANNAESVARGTDRSVEDIDPEEHLEGLIAEHDLQCPRCGISLAGEEVYSFNLMFETTIGPGRGEPGYLRPETAQGIFVDYPRWQEYARKQLPFGVTQIGRAYRNEISPRKGLVRVREFTQAELEFFVDPEEDEPDLEGLRDLELTLHPQPTQDAEEAEELTLTVEEALDPELYVDHPGFDVDGDIAYYEDAEFDLSSHFPVIGDPWIGYFLAISKEWYDSVGMDMERFRYRQHQDDELAHYANDCWDAEAYAQGTWVEITGFAYRGCYDLESHAEHDESHEDYTVFKPFDEPKVVEKPVVDPDESEIGPKYRDKADDIVDALEEKAEESPQAFENSDTVEVKVDDETYELEIELTGFHYEEKEKNGEHIRPHVIEPSFGVGRLTYALIEHSYRMEEDGDDTREYLSLEPKVAPTLAGVFPLRSDSEQAEIAQDIVSELRSHGLDAEYDDTGTIGRRYYRQDEKGTPFCITVDNETLESDTVTIRERDSTEQVRVEIDELPDVLSRLRSSELEFAELTEEGPTITQG